MSDPANPETHLYAHPFHLLASRHLGRLSLRSAKLQTLVIPALGTNLVQGLLLLAVGGRAVLTAAVPGLNSLDEGSVVAVQLIALQIVLVRFFREGESAELGVGPAGTCVANSISRLLLFSFLPRLCHIPWYWLLSSQSSVK